MSNVDFFVESRVFEVHRIVASRCRGRGEPNRGNLILSETITSSDRQSCRRRPYYRPPACCHG